KAALGYPGSNMGLHVKAPDGHDYTTSGIPPVVVLVPNAPAGIYTVGVVGLSGLGAAGEEPFLSVSSLEPCTSASISQNGAVRHAYTGADLASAITSMVPGLSNVTLNIIGESLAGAIITGSGTYNGIGWIGSGVLFMDGREFVIVR